MNEEKASELRRALGDVVRTDPALLAERRLDRWIHGAIEEVERSLTITASDVRSVGEESVA